MSFTIKHGLFRASITDYHAVLGVSLDADPKKIRLKYLRIAQKLHPDTCKADPETKKLAGQILSRLVNPAYEHLSNKTSFAEHQLVLTQIGKRYAEKSDRMTFGSESANLLLKTEKNLDKTYHKILKEITADQYQDVSKILTKIAMVSELNFVYLLLSQKQGINREERVISKQTNKLRRTPPPAKTEPQKPNSPPQPEVPNTQARVDSYVRRAKEYLGKKRVNDAISELKDALKLDPNHSTVHALMGQAYLSQNQVTMAKVHINKAHKANPKDPIVIQSKEQLEKLIEKRERKSKKPKTQNGKKEKSQDSGFFGGLFGSKKK